MPSTPEAYIHISGRTGRAGSSGRAVSIYTRHERDRAGAITQALKNVRWRVSQDHAPPKAVAVEAEAFEAGDEYYADLEDDGLEDESLPPPPPPRWDVGEEDARQRSMDEAFERERRRAEGESGFRY